MDLGIENGEDQFGGDAWSICRAIEFAHKAVIPSIY